MKASPSGWDCEGFGLAESEMQSLKWKLSVRSACVQRQGHRQMGRAEGLSGIRPRRRS